MRRTMWILVAVLAVLAGVAIGVSAYHAGVNHGLVESGHATRVVQIEGRGYFPFGLFLFPLFLFLFFALARGLFWRRRWYGPDASIGHGGWGGHHREAFEDWHQRQHEGSGSGTPGPRGPDQGATV